MTTYNFVVLFFAFCSLFIGLLVWLSRNDAIGKSYFVFSIFVAIWGIGFAIVISPNSTYALALFWDRIANIAAMYIPITWFQFALIYSGRKGEYQNLVRIFYSISILITFTGFTPLFIPVLEPALSFTYYARPGPTFYIFTGMFISIVPLGFYVLCQRMSKQTGIERIQSMGFIIATGTGFTGGALTFLPAYEIMVPQYGLLLMPIYPFVMAYFIIRKKLFDIEGIAQAAHRDKLAAIGTLATSINHELKNPLFVAKGKIESHLDAIDSELYPSIEERERKSKEILSSAHYQLDRAMEIMQRLTDFSRPFNGSKDREPVIIKEVFECVLRLVSNQFEIQKIKVSYPPMNGLAVMANRRQMEEILFNLIMNACQAFDAGARDKGQVVSAGARGQVFKTDSRFKMQDANENGSNLASDIQYPGSTCVQACITLSARQKDNTILIEVSDNGPGISKDQQKQIFEPFYSTKGEKGTGLGLYITKQLVERNGGKISVKSKLGEGTSFNLCFSGKNI